MARADGAGHSIAQNGGARQRPAEGDAPRGAPRETGRVQSEGGRARRLLGDVVRRAAAILNPRSRRPPPDPTGLPRRRPWEAALARSSAEPSPLPPLAVVPRRGPSGTPGSRRVVARSGSGWMASGACGRREGGSRFPFALAEGRRPFFLGTGASAPHVSGPRSYGLPVEPLRVVRARGNGAQERVKRRGAELVWKGFFINSQGHESEAQSGGCDGLCFPGRGALRKEGREPPHAGPPLLPAVPSPPAREKVIFMAGGLAEQTPRRQRAQRTPPP